MNLRQEELEEKLIVQNKKIKVLQQRVRRKERKLIDLNNLLEDLNQNNC